MSVTLYVPPVIRLAPTLRNENPLRIAPTEELNPIRAVGGSLVEEKGREKDSRS